MGTIARYRLMVVLLTAALLATLTVALTGGDRAEAVDGPVDVVYVATGRNFPDALAGSTLAGALGAPLLTVEPNPPLPQATVDALTALDPDRIIVFGGPGAVSDGVVDALTAYARSGSVTRIAGDNRHDTAGAIADALPSKVHDSDLLDGLDSSDFLRTTDADDFVRASDDIDADTLDGIDGFDILTDARRRIGFSGNSSSTPLAAPPAWTFLSGAVVEFPDDCDPDSDSPVASYLVHIEASVEVDHSIAAATTQIGVRVNGVAPPSSWIRTVRTNASGYIIPLSLDLTSGFFEGETITFELVGNSNNEFIEVTGPRLGITTVGFECGLGI